MINKKLRKAIDNYVDEQEFEEETYLLDNHAYDNSIVGITNTGIVVYDYNKMILEFMKDEKCSELEAEEWLEYNTLRALPYMGERRPIIINVNKKNLIEVYGYDNK